MADTYSITRDITIAAPASEVYSRIVDLHRWTEWSPWEDLDPDLRRTYSGAEQGVGATYAWSGNSKAGKGSMTIADVVPDARVTVDVAFEKPMKSTSTSEFTLSDNGASTHVTWTMTGKHSLFSRIASPLGLFDKMLGKDFEKGLSRLKAASE